ncbi:F-box protein At4g35930 [Neltuma alba]|uniref:F-box protein At4g35930 n=1 Tax=Neltuma alba TaxID=207710 RepID=UPI0010A59D8F|nr:F-box protein At4g35930-like [Prosopis alba]
MGKVSLKEKGSNASKPRRRLRSSRSKLLKQGAFVPLQQNKLSPSSTKCCTDTGNKRGVILHSRKARNNVGPEENAADKSPLVSSPVNLVKQNIFFGTPKTPRTENCESESRLESLPIDLWVKILCHLHHDQLRAVFHVSQKIRKAVLIARQFHFNYTTPDRTRQQMLNTMTPRPKERWPFLSKSSVKGMRIPSPHTPKAPRHAPRPPSRLKVSEVRQVAAVLFQESAFPSHCMVPSVLPKPLCKSLASNRALFYEDELCQAVAQNKLL